jgi:hypothetical protein
VSKDEQHYEDSPASDPANEAGEAQEAATAPLAAAPAPDSAASDAPDASSSDAGEQASNSQNAQGENARDEASLEPTTEQTDANEPALPAHFTPIPEEKLARAKRIKRVLIVIIVLLLVILLGTAGTALYYYVNIAQVTGTVTQPTIVLTDEDEIQDRGTTQTIAMPQLTQMFGKTPESVVAQLGSGYTITKTDTVADTDTSTSETDNPADTPAENPTDEPADAATDETASAIAQVVTISYASPDQASQVGATQVQNIYLSLDESGVTVELYFTSSMNLLDFPISSFADLVATRNSFVATLNSAGATVAPELAYPTLTEEEYTTYVDPEASIRKIRKETREWSGALVSQQPPTSFEISYTYDYGASGVENTPDRQPSQRMLHIKLS